MRVLQNDSLTTTKITFESLKLDNLYERKINAPSHERNNTVDFLPEFLEEIINFTPDYYLNQSYWQYFYLNVSEQLINGIQGNEGLKINNPEADLQKMEENLKFSNIDQFQDLIIDIVETETEDQIDVFGGPDIFINLIEQKQLQNITDEQGKFDYQQLKPTMFSNDLNCDFFGEDICVINGKEILDTKTELILVGVFCKSNCTFKLKASLNFELNLKPGKMHQLYFNENQQRIFRFEIPDDQSIDEIEIRGISENKFAEFEMLVLQGNQVPSTQSALVMSPVWENGYIGRFEKDCFCFCVGCNYTVLVSAKSSGYITLGAKLNNQTIDLNSFPGGESFDLVYFWSTQCYTYQVTDPTQDFSVKIQSFAGDPAVYVNPGKIDSQNFSSALFNSIEHFQQEELVLEPKLRQEKGLLTGLYYICIYGRTASNYKISAKNEDHSIMLKAGLSETSYVEQDEIKQFYFTDKSLQDEKIKVQIKLHVFKGNVRIKNKLCSRPDDMKDLTNECNFSKEEMQQESESENTFNHFSQQLVIPDHQVCEQNNFLKTEKHGLRDSGYAQCIYVIGIKGLSNYTSHYSLQALLEGESGKNHPLILSQGVPDFQEIKIKERQFYQITVDDPDIQQLTILLTTLHGDPDLFVSSKTTTPNEKDFEWASINAGMYPDMIVLKQTPEKKFAKNYYISVQSVEDSTYSLVYFTHNSKGEPGIQKLLVGKKQRGVLHQKQNYSNDFNISLSLNETVEKIKEKFEELTSSIYHFQVPASQFADNKTVRIVLNTESGGELMYLVRANLIPSMNSSFKENSEDHWIGGNYKDVIIKTKDLDSEIKQKIQSAPENGSQLLDFYVRVYPNQIFTNDDQNSSQPIVFTIAFYDEEQYIHLADGVPYRGAITSQGADYFYFDILDLNVEYELSLNFISGGYLDLMLTFDQSNKQMRDQKSMLQKIDQFSSDSIILTTDMLNDAIKSGFGVNLGKNVGNTGLQVYLQVNTSDSLAVYSIVMSKRISFNPIKLSLGQVLQGSVKANDTKLYFCQVNSGQKNKPVRIDLQPINGNVILGVTVLAHFALKQTQWQQEINNPTYYVENVKGSETILVDFANDSTVQDKCKQTCVILISVQDQGDFNDDFKEQKSHYRIQVSQDFQELQDGERVQGEIEAYQNDENDFGYYKFYRFYKPCGIECNLEIQIYPNQVIDKVLTVLVNYEDPASLGRGEKTPLPTFQSKPIWTYTFKMASGIVIEGSEPYFSEREHFISESGKVIKTDQKSSSIGYFIIGVHSYANVSFKIAARTIPSFLNKSDLVNIEELYIGQQDKSIYLKPTQTKYFFFRNWREQPIGFTLELEPKNTLLMRHVIMSINQLKQGDNIYGHGSGGRIPKTEKELEERIDDEIKTIYGNNLYINPDDSNFCVMCMYLITVSNTLPEDKDTALYGDTKIRLSVEQNIEDDSDVGHEGQFLQSFLQIGRPQPLSLQKNDIIKLNFETKEELEVQIEGRLGKVEGGLYRKHDQKLIKSFGNETSSFIKINITLENLKHNDVDESVSQGVLSTQFFLILQATSDDYEGNVIVMNDNSLNILVDGKNQDLFFDFRKNHTKGIRKGTKIIQSQYFILLPSSHNMDLQVQASLDQFSSQSGTFLEQGQEVESGSTYKDKLVDPKFFHFKALFKKIELLENLKATDVKWTDEFTQDEQFDEVIHSSKLNIYNKIYTRLHLNNNPETDIILVKFDGIFDTQYSQEIDVAELTYRIRVTSSDINYLSQDEEIRGAITSDQLRYKIFEFNVNPMNFPKTKKNFNQDVDLFIQLTPCTGVLKYFLADNLDDLFKEESELIIPSGYSDAIKNHQLNQGSNNNNTQIQIEHKTSQISKSAFQKSDQNFFSLETQANSGTPDLMIYLDQFGIQGKRIKNVNKIKNKKVFIGIRPLQEEEHVAMMKAYKEQEDKIEVDPDWSDEMSRRRHRVDQRHPTYGAYLHSKDNLSTFRIKASYIESDKPDVLDKYKLENPNYGIKFQALGKTPQNKRKIKISWSPVLATNSSTSEQIQFSVLDQDIAYKLFFAYSDQTAEILSSLCEIQFVEDYIAEEEIFDQAADRHLKACRSLQDLNDPEFLDAIAQNITYITVWEQNEVIIEGEDFLQDLKAIVIVAGIFESDQVFNFISTDLPYAPVFFFKPIDLYRESRLMKIAIMVAVIVFLICFFIMSYWYLSKKGKPTNEENGAIAMSKLDKTKKKSKRQDPKPVALESDIASSNHDTVSRASNGVSNISMGSVRVSEFSANVFAGPKPNNGEVDSDE